MNSKAKRNKTFFRVAAICAAVLPFLAVEIGLQIFGEGDAEAKLSRGMQPMIPLFTWDEDSQQFRTSLPYQQFFAEVSFVPKRPQGRSQAETAGPNQLIFVLGGSTVQGRPFTPETAFPAWAEDYLNDATDGGQIRVVNCGGVSFASDRLSRLVPELLTYDPDLIVIATGHNEFLEDRTYSQFQSESGDLGLIDSVSQLKTVALLRRWMKPDSRGAASTEAPIANHQVKAKLDHQAGYETYHHDADWHTGVVNQFGKSIRLMIDECEAAKVPVCLIELAANSRDCAPLKSEHSPSVSAAAKKAWLISMDKAELAMESMQWPTAISSLQECVLQSPQHALTHFRLARCLRATQRYEEANQHYQFALDYDVCPLRMKSDLVDSMRKIADERSISLISCNDLFQVIGNGRDQCFGFDLFLDHVHPTIRGHQMIGRMLAETIQSREIIEVTEQVAQSDSRGLVARRMAERPAAYFSNGRRRIGWLEDWARAQKTFREVIPITAADLSDRIRRQLELRDDAVVLQLAAVLSKTDDGNLRLINLADDFLRSGQQKPALAALQSVDQTKLTDKQALRFNAIQNRAGVDSLEVISFDAATDLSLLSDSLLSPSERWLLQDILDQSTN